MFFCSYKKKKKEFQYFIFETWIFLAAGMGSKPVFCNEFDAQTGDQPYELYAFMCDPLSPKHRCGFVESLKLGNKLRQRVNVNPLFSTAELKNTKKNTSGSRRTIIFPLNNSRIPCSITMWTQMEIKLVDPRCTIMTFIKVEEHSKLRLKWRTFRFHQKPQDGVSVGTTRSAGCPLINHRGR